MMDKINNVIRTLNKVQVSGKENLDMLLGCIMVLEQIAVEYAEKEVKTDG